jgi:hypothetical protein
MLSVWTYKLIRYAEQKADNLSPPILFVFVCSDKVTAVKGYRRGSAIQKTRVRSFLHIDSIFFPQSESSFETIRKTQYLGMYILWLYPGLINGNIFPSRDCLVQRHPIRVGESIEGSCISAGLPWLWPCHQGNHIELHGMFGGGGIRNGYTAENVSGGTDTRT